MRNKNRFGFWQIALLSFLASVISMALEPAHAQIERQRKEIIPGIPEGFTIVEGDIQIPIDVINAMRSGEKSKTNAPQATYQIRPWPNGVVPFLFQDTAAATSSCAGAPLSGFVSPANRTAMRNAMAVIEAAANVSFRECANNSCGRGNPPHLLIRDSTNDTTAGRGNVCQSSSGNSSEVGYKGRGQNVNIVSWTGTASQGIIIHELMHALGFEHEQSRPDRDAYVDVASYCANVIGGCMGDTYKVNFPIEAGATAYGYYDFNSVMHYGQCDFSRNDGTVPDPTTGRPAPACPTVSPAFPADGGVTIRVKEPYWTQWQGAIGQRAGLSDLDRLTLSFLYPEPNWRFVNGSFPARPALDGTFLIPYISLQMGINSTPVGGTLWVQPGTYFANSLTKAIQIKAPLGGVEIRALQGAVGDTLATVSAASYNGEVASESIAVAFGLNLASVTASASSVPLPTTLGGVTVKVKDSENVDHDAPLFFVSSGQVNYLVPSGAGVGPANVAIVKDGVPIASGEVAITATAPGVFTADSSGGGPPAAVLLRVRGEEQTIEAVTRFDEELKKFVPLPIDLGPEGDQVFLILFGTGFRSANAQSSITAMIGDEQADIPFAGGLAGFAGLDQANIRLPRSLAGKGEVSLLLIADNRSANAVRINVR
jgi:uncharacterized protein (TIGR03437 family)